MVMLIIMVLGAATVLLSSLSSAALQINRDKINANALAQAKEALIGYAVTSENGSGTNARPGNFPCPDTDAPNTAGYGDENAVPTCVSGAIGRLPWETLGMPELLDGEGEPLWYAISGNFRKSATRINSDSRGTLLVYDRDGGTLLTPSGSEAVAIVFAPGGIIGDQKRNTAADKTAASNYLDTANGRNNATAGGAFIAASKTSAFNDRLIIVRARDFIPAIEKRVSKEVKAMLANYFADNGFYPYPAKFDGSCTGASCNTFSDINVCRGRLPKTALPFDWQYNYSFPAWFFTNRWYHDIYYSAGANRLATAPPGCGATLNVSGNSTAALFFMPGTPLGSMVRTYPSNNLSLYLEDAENRNMDDSYSTPAPNSNDRLHALP